MTSLFKISALCPALALVSTTTLFAADTSPPVAALVQANNRFAMDIFQKVCPQATENAFLSPYSLSSALAMTWAGAKGDTADQMARALHLAEMPAGEVTHDFSALNEALAEAQTASGAQLSVANSLWPQQNPESPFLPEYLTAVEKDFAAGLFPVDYQNHSEEARLKINQWVEDKTQDKITNMLHPGDVTELTRLALVNAIYFKGQWAAPFEPGTTGNQPFKLADGSSKSVKLMNHTFEADVARYADITNGPAPCQLLLLNYFSNPPDGGGDRGTGRGAPQRYRGPSNRQPGFGMLVVLPRAAGDLGALEKAATAEQLTAWIGEMKPARVRVFLPKFRLEARYPKLPDQLKQLGVVKAFNSSADFSGMDGATDLYISKVIHQTFVAVDENGTEAAGATVVLMGFKGAPPSGQPMEFRADHPFLFFIRENATGSILFMGRLADPPPGNQGI